MELLRAGITCDRRMELADFKAACYEAARLVGEEVSRIRSPNVTPNFFSATIGNDSHKSAILGNLAYPIVAFATEVDERQWLHSFIDRPDLAEVFRTRGYECPDAAELMSRVGEADLKSLRETELKDIKYWNPGTIGEIVFNYWD